MNLWRLGSSREGIRQISDVEGSQGAAKRWPSCPWQHLRGRFHGKFTHKGNKGRDGKSDSKGCLSSLVGLLKIMQSSKLECLQLPARLFSGSVRVLALCYCTKPAAGVNI